MAAAAAADGAGAASDAHDESDSPPQKKACHEQGARAALNDGA